MTLTWPTYEDEGDGEELSTEVEAADQEFDLGRYTRVLRALRGAELATLAATTAVAWIQHRGVLADRTRTVGRLGVSHYSRPTND